MREMSRDDMHGLCCDRISYEPVKRCCGDEVALDTVVKNRKRSPSETRFGFHCEKIQ